eukprot:510141-Pyramimonas_sp.AAC.1
MRRLTAVDTPKTTNDDVQDVSWKSHLKHTTVSILWLAIGRAIGCVQRGNRSDGCDHATRGPCWDPSGNVSFLELTRE